MKIYNQIPYCFLLLLFFSCSEQKPNFDFERWRQDEDGCSNHRVSLLKDYEQINDYLMQKSGKEIVALLGKPDITELSKRHIKTYIYFIDPKENRCNANESQKLSRASCIEFNSIGKVSIISQQMR